MTQLESLHIRYMKRKNIGHLFVKEQSILLTLHGTIDDVYERNLSRGILMDVAL